MIRFVPNWKSLWRAYTVWAASIGLALPEVLAFVAANTHELPWFDSDVKAVIRVVCLIGVIVLRPVAQPELKAP